MWKNKSSEGRKRLFSGWESGPAANARFCIEKLFWCTFEGFCVYTFLLKKQVSAHFFLPFFCHIFAVEKTAWGDGEETSCQQCREP